MFKKIKTIFGLKDTEQKSSTPRDSEIDQLTSEPSNPRGEASAPISRSDEINRLILAHKRRLATLEEKQALYGPDTAPAIVTEIEKITQKIAALEATLKDSAPLPLNIPGELERVYHNAKESLDDFRKTVNTTENELDFMPEESQSGAIRLVKAGKSQLSKFDEEWANLDQQQSVSEDTLQTFIRRIFTERQNLSILVQRGIHRRNLGILEKQLALQQSALTKDALETTLRPQMDFELEKIAALEEKKRLDANDQERLAIHRNNLKIYQAMLAGQRPFAPLSLINQTASQEQAIQNIDKQLVV